MCIKYLFVLISLFALVTMASAQINDTSTKGAVLGPGDEIAGKVVGEPEYDFMAIVNEQGYIEVPFSETPVLAKCRTETELRNDLTERLAKYLKKPQFSFRVTNRNSRPPTTIAGEVNQPQQVVLMRKVTLLELLTIGGGPKEESAGGLVQVFRPQAPQCPGSDEDSSWKGSTSDPTQMPYRTYSLKNIRMGQEDSNPIIYPGDLVMVQRASLIYITGEVVAPQGIYLKEGGISLSEAVAKVGGPRREAKMNDIRIHRVKPGTVDDHDIIAANYKLIKAGQEKDVILQPGDIVEVGLAKPGVGKTILDIAVGAAKSSVMAFGNAVPYRVIY
jgi:polysaccharide export outer membrane protein